MEEFRLPKGELFISGNGKLKGVYQRLIKIYDPLLFFCRKGKGVLMIDLKECEVKENTLVFLMPGSIVSCPKRTEDLEFSVIVSSGELLHEISFRFDLAYLGYLKNNLCIQFPEESVERIMVFFDATTKLYEEREHAFRIPMFKNIMQCFLMDVYEKVFRPLNTVSERNYNRSESLFKNFIQLVHENYINEREVSFYADKLCITARYLSSVVNSVSGHTPKEIIDSFVVLEIKALLQSTDLSMQEIANQLHFPDQSFFGRYFKKHTGVMPSRYRQENK